jgi:hypothetical protein
MTESPGLPWLAHTLPAKSRVGKDGSRLLARGLAAAFPETPVAVPSGEWITRIRKPLTVAGPRRIRTDFRAPFPVFSLSESLP